MEKDSALEFERWSEKKKIRVSLFIEPNQNDIIKAKAKTETAKTLRKQIRSNKTTSVKGAKGVGKTKSTDLDNLDLSLTSL